MVGSLKNKKGVAMESAIIFMTVIIALSFLLTTVIMIGHLNLKRNNSAEAQRLELEQIGTYYLASLQGNFNFDDVDFRAELSAKGYVISVSDRQLTVTQGETVVLYLRADNSGKPIVWRYSAPPEP